MFKAETAPNEQDQDEIQVSAEDNGDDNNGEITREDLLKADRSDDEAEGDDETEGEAKAEGEDDAEEFEITLDGDDGSHPEQDENRGIRKRINKLNRKVEAAEEGKEKVSSELEIERERNRLLQLALDQQGGKAPKDDGAPPDPNDFDDGIADAKYIQALEDHMSKRVLAKAQEAQIQTRTATEAQGKLYDRQVDHYERAKALKVPDYEVTEDKAIEVFGQDVVNQLISNTDKSPELLYYLGKNTGKAQELADLVKANPVKGVFELGRLGEKLKAKPKSKSKPAPDPDGDQRGGGAGTKKARRGPAGAKFE